jgi:hypothetical protein
MIALRTAAARSSAFRQGWKRREDRIAATVFCRLVNSSHTRVGGKASAAFSIHRWRPIFAAIRAFLAGK